MGIMSALAIDVEELLFEGATPEQIAAKLNLSVEQVEAYIQLLEDSDRDYDDSMDGDFDTGMASAGFGTDEDYGYYGDE
jgi:DNA-directed RNA polymerase sigma subunit (sigma70/sigma32)